MYIHEKNQWTNFVWNNEAIYPLLVKTRYLQGNLLGRMQNLGFNLKTESTLISLTLDVVDTSKMELQAIVRKGLDWLHSEMKE